MRRFVVGMDRGQSQKRHPNNGLLTARQVHCIRQLTLFSRSSLFSVSELTIGRSVVVVLMTIRYLALANELERSQ